MSEQIAFDVLRQRGVSRAQDASREIWTDYNVHDPGVSLLELFCYALTELDYRADFPVADLLVDADGHLNLKAQALAAPADALPTWPVTRGDWVAALSNESASVSRVFVRPHVSDKAGEIAGLFDIYVVPADDSDEAAANQALVDVHTAFSAQRNLCEDIARLEIAKPVDVKLEAEIRLTGRHAPERAAAQIYHLVEQLLRDGDCDTPPAPATRRDVAAAPERYFGPMPEFHGENLSIARLFDAIAAIEQVVGVLSLTLDPPLETPLPPGAYRRIYVPSGVEDLGLRFSVADRPAKFDIHEMHVELGRLRAERRMITRRSTAEADWNAIPDGRPRNFAHTPLGPGLPTAYLANGEALAISTSPRDRGAAAQIRGYLAHFDALLANMGGDLTHLNDLYSGRRPTAPTYFPGLLDVSAVKRAASSRPEAEFVNLAGVVVQQDPRHDRKGRVLDYLLALYAEEFSQNSLRRHDLYRSASDRRDAILKNRSELLGFAAEISRSRFTGGAQGGLRHKLEILLELPGSSGLTASAFDILQGSAKTDDIPPPNHPETAAVAPMHPSSSRPPPHVPSNKLPAPENPLLMLAPRADAPEIDIDELIRETAFLRYGLPGDDAIGAGALQDSWILSPASNDRWRLFFLPIRPGPAYLCATFRTRDAAAVRANQLRAMFGGLNRRSETVYVVEDLLLRATDDDANVAPMFIWAVFSGWTERTRDPEFRHLAEETVVRICPAHLSHRAVWLDRSQMATFEALSSDLEGAWPDNSNTAAASAGPAAGPRLRTFLKSVEEAD